MIYKFQSKVEFGISLTLSLAVSWRVRLVKKKKNKTQAKYKNRYHYYDLNIVTNMKIMRQMISTHEIVPRVIFYFIHNYHLHISN